MPYTIVKTYSFDAAHHLPHLPEGHKCRRMHGHTYAVTLELASPELDADGFVLDYGRLSQGKNWLMDTCDHQDLNAVCPYPTTSENLARWFYETLVPFGWPLSAVSVSETPSSSATYRP